MDRKAQRLRELGFDAIILSSVLGQCRVPVCSAAVQITNSTNHEFTVALIDGSGIVVPPGTRLDLPDDFDELLEIDNVSASHEPPEAVLEVWDYFRDLVGHVFATPTTFISLNFGILDDAVFLLDGRAVLSANPYLENLFRGEASGPRGFAEFLVRELAASRHAAPGVCYSGFDGCGAGNYVTDVLPVILHRAREQFPRVDRFRLCDTVRSRIAVVGVAPLRVPVCVSCVSLYTVEQRMEESTKAPAVFPADPYSYGINLMKNPYRDAPIRPMDPLPPPPRNGARPIRRARGAVSSPQAASPRKYAAVRRWRHDDDALAPTARGRSFAERKAVSLYRERPFNLGFLNGRPPIRSWL
jgi:hypothetical protein